MKLSLIHNPSNGTFITHDFLVQEAWRQNNPYWYDVQPWRRLVTQLVVKRDSLNWILRQNIGNWNFRPIIKCIPVRLNPVARNSI